MEINGFYRFINLEGSLGKFPVTGATVTEDFAGECRIPDPALFKPLSAIYFNVFTLDSSLCCGRSAFTATGHQILFRWKTGS